MLGSTTARRSRTIGASAEAVWELVVDPFHQPRWWPGVERMEGVDGPHFTQVLRSSRGRPVRADFTIVELEALSLTVWQQELAGSPFARVLEHSLIRLELTAAGPSTTVTIAHEQTLRGASRTGALMLRRATSRRLEQALTGLAGVLGGEAV